MAGASERNIFVSCAWKAVFSRDIHFEHLRSTDREWSHAGLYATQAWIRLGDDFEPGQQNDDEQDKSPFAIQ